MKTSSTETEYQVSEMELEMTQINSERDSEHLLE